MQGTHLSHADSWVASTNVEVLNYFINLTLALSNLQMSTMQDVGSSTSHSQLGHGKGDLVQPHHTTYAAGESSFRTADANKSTDICPVNQFVQRLV